MNNTLTPKSDKNTYNKHQDNCPTSVVPSLICRQLERELTAAREELAELKEEYGTWWAQKRIAIDELKKVTEQRDAVTLRLGDTQVRMFDAERQRDRLAGGLKWIAGWNHQLFDENTAMQMRDKAEQALQSLNQPTQ